ncbi:MAG: hypothetical protein ACLQMT_13120 [Candidatus Acidiferrales bacterium]
MKGTIALFLFLLFATPMLAQNQAALAAAGCGSDKIQFDVKTDKKQHPAAQPDPGKALVYVFEQEKLDPGSIDGLHATTRIGLDGQWVGANHGESYFFFSVDPGEHNLCANWQSSLGMYSKLASAATLSAEAGHVYYFQTTVGERTHRQPAIWLKALDPAEGNLLLASSSFSTSHPKK